MSARLIVWSVVAPNRLCNASTSPGRAWRPLDQLQLEVRRLRHASQPPRAIDPGIPRVSGRVSRCRCRCRRPYSSQLRREAADRMEEILDVER
jgi:hypothetical protein